MAEKTGNKTISLLIGVLILAAGVILIICNKMITGRLFVVLAGVLFIVTGIVNLILYVTRRNPDGTPVHRGFALFFGWLVSIASIILGLCMLVFTETFGKMVPFIFAILIFFGALMLVFSFLFGLRKVIRIPAWTWLFPVAMTILGIITICQEPDTNDPLIMIMTGSSMILFGLAALLTGALASGARKQAMIDSKTLAGSRPSTVDVEAEDVSDKKDTK